ncbi:RNA polymerase sigma factor SigJ [Aliikangiella coralliicola]|uniref:Sigma-70 family RNA polymerase sigma factor n=1 Tax=Aliikangiella coralliicola TaxID=2592383 RepID=A0A545UG05_9GAMM|nr:RNA polymerase sigma factor SigJ [Aliikangiella coralliicola]TQV88323.1 sigma-70 family RNA polymerase sigma factor [Aliikangiella coralliicola]
MSDKVVEIFEKERGKLLGLAYRITGSYLEAEDIVHETFIKWFHSNNKTIAAPYAWMIKVTTRLSLDYLKSARVQRESYVGPWLPEPFVDDKALPENEYELDQSISMALMVLLESLSVNERASYILHDLFQMNFEDIGELLDKSPASCRKLASRARAKIIPSESSLQKTKEAEVKEDYRSIINAFFDAIKSGDIDNLKTTFRNDIVFHSDGGGKAAAALKVLHGRDAVSRFLMRVLKPNFKESNDDDVNIVSQWFNGVPGVILQINGQIVTAFQFDLYAGKINGVYALRNPDKLAVFTRH